MCDTAVVVGDGFVLFGKNSDRDPNEAQRLSWYPRRETPAGSTLVCTWLAIPQARRTHAVVLSRPYWMWGAEMGANEHQVVIGNEAVFTRSRRRSVGLLGMDLVRLALERAATADEAVEVITRLLSRHGQGGRCGYDDAGFHYDNSFLIADPNGAIVLETAGREFTTERVRGARAISNGLTIEPFATRHQDRLRGAVAQCRARRRAMEAQLQEATAPEHVAAALRTHGGDDPVYNLINGGMGAPCMHAGGLVANSQTVGSWITALGPGGPRHYATATAAPCLSGFKPVEVHRPVDLGSPTGVVDDRSAWWRFEALHRSLIVDPAACAAHRVARDDWERATWRGDRTAEAAFDEWDAFVTAALARPRPATDRRPAVARRYWAQRDRDARAAAPKLPPWREVGTPIPRH